MSLYTALESIDYDELLEMIRWLPRDSAMFAVQQAGGSIAKAQELFGWNTIEDLMLGQINLTQHLIYVIKQVNSQKKVQPPESVSGPRGQAPNKSKGQDANTMARALLQAQRKG